MRGATVADLQQALKLLLDRGVILRDDEGARRELSAALEREHASQTYGGATGKLVGIFQEAHHLEVMGEVDERTAAALNGALTDLGAFDAPPDIQKRVVAGRLLQEDQTPFKGAVVLFHEGDHGSIRLGEDATGTGGHYTIRYETLPGLDSVNARVVALDEAGRTVKRSDVLRGAGPLQIIDLVVPVVQSMAVARRMEGRIAFDHGAPAQGLTLRLYRLGFGGADAATRLAETKTLEHGVYSLPYAADGNAANLEIRAVDEAGQEVTLSKIVRNAEEREALNLVAPAATRALAPEFARLADDLRPHIGEFGLLRTARETVEQQDLTLLHEASGWDARLIATAALATRLSAQEETGLPQDALYGLLRAGLPSDKLQLAQVSAEAFDLALNKARTAGIVQIDEAAVPQIRKDFEAFSVKARLAVQAPGSQATYGQMLSKLDLGEDEQKAFAKLYLNHRGDAQSLWVAADNAGLGAIVPKLQRQGKLAFLTTNNPELTQKLQADLGDAGPQQLVKKGLYKKEAWLDRIDVVPSAYAGAPDPKDAYAADMARKVRISYSTEVAWNMIDSGEMEIEGGNDNLSAVLRKAIDKGFKLGQTAIAPFFNANQEVFGDLGESDRRTTTQMLETLHRVYQITPGHDAMKALLSAGLLSAQDVLAYPLDVFLERFGGLFPSVEQARLVYQKAEQVSNITYSLFSLAKELDSTPAVFAMSGSPEIKQAAKDELVKHFPTMESLFGSLDYCECEECRSVLSPAAYLVDLLQFLDREPKVWQNTLKDWKAKHGTAPYPFRNRDVFDTFLARWRAARPGEPDPNTERTPYEILIDRRPDLPHIALTCENTNTVLPQIDLVNEILEYYVANNRLNADAARDTGDVATAELLAEPQHVIAEAYAALQSARYPLTLPFDLWIETARAFTAHFDVPLWRLLDTFRQRDDLFAPTAEFDRAAVFFESLGLTQAEVDTFSNPDPLSDWFKLYGFETSAKALDEAVDPETGRRMDLNSAKALSRRLGVTYKEITAIVQTAFANPVLSDLTLLYKLDVTIADALSYAKNKALYDDNHDLVGKKRPDLGLADQLRFDELTQKLPDSQLTLWDVVNEAAAFEHRLSDLATTFDTPLQDLRAAVQAIPFGKVLVLVAPDAGCDFDQTRLQYANGKKVDGIALLRINLFVRLWRKLGWSIEELDRALTTFTPHSAPFDEDPANLAQRPLMTALIYLAHLHAIDQAVKAGKQSRLKLLTLWSNMPTTGKQPLYAQLFLNRSARRSGEVEVLIAGTAQRVCAFDDPLGSYLEPTQLARLADQVRYEVRLSGVKAAEQVNAAAFAGEERLRLLYDELGEVQTIHYVGILTDEEKERIIGLAPNDALSTLLTAVQAKAAEFPLLKGHMLPLQGALGLTAGEIAAILVDVDSSLDKAPLTLSNVSTLYRYGLFAKALNLSVAELIAFKQLSGLNPFKPLHANPLARIEDDHPFSQTLRFVEVVNAVKASGLKVDDLDYLLRHRFDQTSKYRPNREATLAWLKTLADGTRAIRAEQAAPDDPGALTEEVLRQKLGLVLPTDVVERFLALMNGTAEFEATQTVAPADQLHPADFPSRADVVIRVMPYNAAKQQQRLVLQAGLSQDQKAALKDGLRDKLTAGQQAVFARLLDGAQDDAKRQIAEFFARNLQRKALNERVTRGFLEAADFDRLLVPPSPVSDDLTVDEKKAVREANESLRRQKLGILASAFFPFLQRRLIRQFLVQQVVAYTTADPVLVESLLTDARLLATGDALPVMAALEALGNCGVSASFYDTPDLQGRAQGTGIMVASADTALKDKVDQNGNPLNPASGALFEGALTVPTPGAYRFTIELEKKGSKAELRFEHLPTPLFLEGEAEGDNTTLGIGPAEYLELKPGLLYRFNLTLKNLAGGRARMLVEGESLTKADLNRLPLYPAFAVTGAEDATLLLSKALQIAGALGLSEREIRYLLTHHEDFGKANFSDLPIRGADDTDDQKKASVARFDWFLRLASYVRVKLDLAGGTDELIGVFEADGTAGPDRLDRLVYPLVAKLTRRDEATVKEVARALAHAPSFASEEPLDRLWKALQMVQRFGVPVASLLEWTRIVSPKARPARRSEIASHLKEAIKARFEPETWLRVAQPIFDKLRQRQRDALVAHVMHRHGFDRIEQLFEFFLIDPGAEPVVQTSRIRSAIGAVQIFVHRCLLNLEPQVAASAINSKQWQWMKRYPVWAGNRKLWLFPENVLEPEFRDDKTHLFSEVEGMLLQSDVNNDVAEDAFFTYLKKLDELARLDIVAMYCEEQPLDPASNQLHVIGRTYLEPYRYFYRRYTHDMWTPWEPMPVDIEGNHIVPVVWRDRLNVFWVTFIDNPDPDAGLSDDGLDIAKVNVLAASGGMHAPKTLPVGLAKDKPAGKKLTELSLGQLAGGVRSGMTQKLVKVQLHWSEYFQGEWSVRESGGYGASLVHKVALDFDSATVFIHATKEFGDDGAEGGVRIHLGGKIDEAFRVVSRNSRPARVRRDAPPPMPYNAPEVQANRYRGSGAFKVTFTQRIETEVGKGTKTTTATPSILQDGEGFTVLPCANTINLGTPEIASLVSPLFYQDDRSNTFFVEPTFREKTVEEWQEWVTRTPQPEVEWDRPEWWDKLDLKPLVPKVKLPIPVHPGDPIWRTEIDPRARFELAPRQDWLVNAQTLVQFDGELVGTAGRAGLTVRQAAVVGAREEAGPAIAVNAGSAIAPSQSVVAVDTTALAAAGLSQNRTGLNIIGGAGLNSALLKNMNGAKAF
jgi:hypothetical protein